MYKTQSRYQYSMLLNAVGLFAFISFAGCTNNATPSESPEPTPAAEVGMTDGSPQVSPYIKVRVVTVEVRFLGTNPVQVELVIRGTLPDQCKYEFYSIENRADQNVKVSLDGIHPADMGCLQITQNIEYVLGLGRDMPEAGRGFSPGDYKLTVNNYQTSFSIK
jgi:hypothetical protein